MKTAIEIAREGLANCEVVKSVMMPVNQQNYATLCRKLLEVAESCITTGQIPIHSQDQYSEGYLRCTKDVLDILNAKVQL